MLKLVAKLGKHVAVKATGTASYWGIYEPKMPKKLKK